MPDCSRIELNCDELNTPIKKLKAWIILTDEYGKPSDYYLDDFLHNFGYSIKNGNFTALNKYDISEFNKHFKNDEYKFEGGWSFYNFASKLRDLEIEEIKRCIKDWSVDEYMAFIDNLLDDVSLEIKSENNDYVGYIDYNSAMNQYIIREGSKVRHECDFDLTDFSKREIEHLFESGYIDKDTLIVKSDIQCSTITEATSVITRSRRGPNGVCIKGTNVSLLSCLKDKEMYNRYILKTKDDDDMLMDNLKDSVTLRVVGEGNGRGNFDGTIEYNNDTKQFIIKEGSLICGQASNSLEDRYFKQARNLVETGVIDIKTHRFTKDFACKTLSLASTIITMRANCYDSVFIENTDIGLKEALENPWLYNQFIRK